MPARDLPPDEALRDQQMRLKNFASTLRSVSRRTAEECGDLDAYMALFDSRLDALVRAHGALARSAGQGVDLGELVGDALHAHAPAVDGWVLDGPPVRAPEASVEVFALVFGELAAWSAAAGALSARGAGLEVRWDRLQSDPRRIRLVWRDTVAGPSPLSPFLLGLVERGLSYQPHTQGRVTLNPRDLTFSLMASLTPVPR